jgi:electron transport complex protein RnfE
MDFKKQLHEGLLTKNPVLVQLLGMCSTLAITTSLFNGLGMGVAVTVILICSNVLISALRKVIPSQIRIAAYIVIIAGFVTVVHLLMQAFLPELSESLGVFIPLIVVNCIVLGRAEAFASKNSTALSALDGLAMGIGFTLALTIVAAVRELFGNGTLLGLSIFGAGYDPALIMILAPGGFITLGLILGLINKLMKKKA